jgi:hypothetical protein
LFGIEGIDTPLVGREQEMVALPKIEDYTWVAVDRNR